MTDCGDVDLECIMYSEHDTFDKLEFILNMSV